MSGFSTARQKMVDGQVRPSDVTDIRILDAMLAVPREAFVPENKQALAYLDLDLDVSEGGSARRFLIKPVVLAKMLQAAEIKADRPGAGGRLRHRIRRGRDRRICRAGDGDGERSGARGEGEGTFWPGTAVRKSQSGPRRRPMETRRTGPMMSSC